MYMNISESRDTPTSVHTHTHTHIVGGWAIVGKRVTSRGVGAIGDGTRPPVHVVADV